MKNLIRSEGYSRNELKKDQTDGELILKLDYQNEQIPLRYLNVSLPGGVLSIQAICNIFENFIRNSAKYWNGESDRRSKNLEFTFKATIDNDSLCVVIYDNKEDAEQTVDTLNSKLHYLSFINSDNSINKDDKGIKEMLLSYIWLISNTLDESISSYVSNTSKLWNSLQQRFEFVAVDNNGDVVIAEKGTNLGLKFHLPIHYTHKEISSITNGYKIFADVYSADSKLIEDNKLFSVFPRIVDNSDGNYQLSLSSVLEEGIGEPYTDTAMLYSAMCKRFDRDIDMYKISMGGEEESRKCPDGMCICFETHFSDHPKHLEKIYKEYLYYDSISGANYTNTLMQVWSDMLCNYDVDGNAPVRSWRDKTLALKIKESALSRITIIDERLLAWIETWADCSSSHSIRNSQVELSLKNIRVLNWTDDESVEKSSFKNQYHKIDGSPFLCGNEFRPVGPYAEKPNKTTFLSIHLGLIEKMLNGSSEELKTICGEKGNNALSKERIALLMEKIKQIFEPDFICIHSGRGGLSKELEDSVLSEYPFVPFATLETLFNDSKFLLSQMFYSLKYNHNTPQK